MPEPAAPVVAARSGSIMVCERTNGAAEPEPEVACDEKPAFGEALAAAPDEAVAPGAGLALRDGGREDEAAALPALAAGLEAPPAPAVPAAPAAATIVATSDPLTALNDPRGVDVFEPEEPALIKPTELLPESDAAEGRPFESMPPARSSACASSSRLGPSNALKVSGEVHCMSVYAISMNIRKGACGAQ
jgi:hypothetical protein